VNATFWQTLQYADSSAERALSGGAMGEGRFEVGSADPACAPDSGRKSEIRNPNSDFVYTYRDMVNIIIDSLLREGCFLCV